MLFDINCLFTVVLVLLSLAIDVQSSSQSKSVFPSLLRQVAESEQRTYHFGYTVNLYKPPEEPGSKQVLLSKQNVQEWFSYELATQTIVRSFEKLPNTSSSPSELRGEKYLRLFNIMQDSSVNYKIVFSLDASEPFRCEFGSLDPDASLASGSKLLRRPLEFHNHATKGRHRGELIGLGALLMNIADIHHKRANELQHELRLGSSNYQMHVEWQVDDFADTGQRWFLYFGKPTLEPLVHHESSVADLTRIELRHRIAQKAKESGGKSRSAKREPLGDTYGLVMDIEVKDFTNSLYQDEMDRAFRVPPICPEAQDVQTDESSLGEGPQINLPNQAQDDDEAPGEEPIGFPSFDESLGLDQNYKISSRWKFLTAASKVDTELRVTEYFDMEVQTIGESGQQVERSLFSRLDVALVDVETGSERDRTRYFLYHSINLLMMCRDSEERCSQIYSLDHWLMVVSSKMSYQFDSIQIDSTSEQLRHFGVGALWSVASGTELVESRPQEYADEFVWRLRGEMSGLLDTEAEVLFRFESNKPIQIGSKTGSIQVPRLTLKSLTIDSRKFADFTKSGARLLEISEIVLEPNTAQPADFDLPDYCRETQNFANLNRAVKPLLSSDPSERRANFLTLRHSLRLDEDTDEQSSSRNLPFKLSYQLIVSSSQPDIERRFQVTEMNLPQLNRSSVTLEVQDSGNQTLRLWSLEKDVKLFEQVQQSECKQAPLLESIFHLASYLDLIEGEKADWKMDFLLAHLWEAFGERVMDWNQANTKSNLVMSKQSAVVGGKQLDTIRWSLFDADSQLIVFEFIEPKKSDKEAQLRLNSVSLVSNSHKSGHTFRFMLKHSSEVEQDDELKMKLPAICERYSRYGPGFPKMSLLDLDERYHMRSALVVKEKQSSIDSGLEEQEGRIYMLDEWLQSRRAYRARLVPAKGAEETGAEAGSDFLIDLVSGEFFDLSQVGRCKMSPIDGEDGADYVEEDTMKSLGLLESERLVSHLFHAKSPVFYGPLSVGILAEKLKQTPLSDHSLQPLDVLDLSDETKVDRWFSTNFWLIEHPRKRELKMRIAFRTLKDVGRHSIALQSVASSSWHENEPTIESYFAEVVNYNFESELRAREPKLDQLFRVPKGFGCKRNEKAKRKFTSKDIVVFNELSPFEFEYEASMSAVPEDTNGTSSLQLLAVIQSGWFGRCPASWNMMLIGALRVNRQRHHFLDGRLRSRLRVASRNVGAPETLIRTLDETSGSCAIEQLPADGAFSQRENEREILVLEFGAEKIHLQSGFFEPFERGAKEFERIQEFSEARVDGQLITTVVYESHRTELKLNERLQGEGFIVKTFRREPNRTKTLDLYNYHTDLEIEVIILDKAHLRMRVSGLQFGECYDMIRAARAQECFMDDEDSASRAMDQSVSHAHLQHHFESETQHSQRLRSFELKFEPQDGKQITSEQFANEKTHLERSFMRVLLSSPGQVPAMQLGEFRLLFERRHSSIWAHFNLIEPVSVRHTFHLLEGQAIRQQPKGMNANAPEVSGQLVSASSLAKCADLCEKQQRNQAGRRLCVAFSYCRDRSCQTLLGPTKNLSEFYSKWLSPNLQANPDCRVFHGDFLQLAATRRYVDDLVESVHQQQGGPLLSNKYVLGVKLEDNSTVKFIARQLAEKTASEKQSSQGDEVHPISEQFTLVSKDSALQVSGLDKRSAYLSGKLIHGSSLPTCQLTCETRAACSLVSYCKSTQICTLITNITTWDQYRDTLNFNIIGDKQNSCSVYSHNFLNDFELFEGTREPKTYVKKALNFRLEECAAYCQLEHSDLETNCLSFDFCQSPGENPVCYLQAMHLIMDDFDESILEQTDPSIIRSQLDGKWRGLEKPTFCSHYSRSLVADFALKKKTKFTRHKSIVFQGTQLEQCALICRRDETCLAFEYCHLKLSRVNTCYLERNNVASDEQDLHSETIEQNQQLEESDECNVYELERSHYQEDKALALQFGLNLAGLNESSQEQVPQALSTSVYFIESLLVVASFALVTGFLLGLVYGRMARRRSRTRRNCLRL